MSYKIEHLENSNDRAEGPGRSTSVLATGHQIALSALAGALWCSLQGFTF